MFGLWYLSLAIDELRKHFGWSSIFDAFKSSKTEISNKAIEDKKPSNNVADNKNQVPKPISRPAPEPPKQTVVEPPKPVVMPSKPAPEPPKPVVEPPKPAPEPPKPVVEIPKPAPEPPKPIVEPSKPVTPITPPKSPSPPKPSTPTKQITPPVTPPASTPKKETSPPQPKTPNASPSNANSNNFDRNMFAPSKKLENGDGPGNIKDATTSFLQEEGRPGFQGPNKPQSTPSNVNFKQL